MRTLEVQSWKGYGTPDDRYGEKVQDAIFSFVYLV